MKIAVTYAQGQVYQHFGHAEYFKLYTVEGGKVVTAEVVTTEGSGHGALAAFLAEKDVSALICGGIGGGARLALAQQGILIYGGVQGEADAAVEAYLHNNLNYNPNAKCDHHDHEDGHVCGDHGCGSHSCGNH